MADDQKDSTNPFSHIHKGLDHMNKPSMDYEKMEDLGWGLEPERMKPEVNGKAVKLEQELLETLTYLTEAERLDLSIEKVIARAAFDLPALAFDSAFARSSVAVKGRGRADVRAMVGGSTPKISVPTTLQKMRRVFRGRGGKVQSVEEESGYEMDTGRETE